MARSTKIKSKLIAEDSVEFSQLSAETVLILDSNKNIDSSSVTPNELDNLIGTTSPIQTQLNDESNRIAVIEDNNKILTVYAYENNAQIFADAQPGIKDPSSLIRDGWYFKNGVAGQKINWYYFDGTSQGNVTLGDLKSSYAVMTFDAVSGAASPIIAIYTFPTGTGDVIPGFAHSRIVYDGPMTPTPVVGKQYLVYAGENPPVHPQLPRINLALIPGLSIGDKLPTEQILTVSFSSNSAASVNSVQYMVETLGLFSDPVKHEMDLRIRVASQLELDTHEANTSNPHSVTKDQVGLGNVDNTSDADKPVSDATQDALDLKYDASNPANYVDAAGAASAAPVQSVNTRTGVIVLSKTDVGLDQVDNTSDADKPISDATQDALNLITDVNWTGDYNNGVTYTVGDGVMFNGASFRMIATIGAAGYNPVAYPANWLQVTEYVSPNDIGLGNVDNTSDADKPVSDSTQDALDLKVNLAGDIMTGSLTQDDGAGNTNTLSPDGQFIVGGDLSTEYARLGYYINWTPAGSTIQRTVDGSYSYLTLNEFDSSTNASKTIDIQLSGISMNESLDGSPATPIMPVNDDNVVVKKYVDDNFVSNVGDTMTGPLNIEDGPYNAQLSHFSLNFSDSTTPGANCAYASDSILINTPDGVDSRLFNASPYDMSIQIETPTAITKTVIEPAKISLYTVNGGVIPATPTNPEHVTTKKYVDDLVGSGGADVLEKFQAMKEPTGFIDRTSSITSFNDSTREFTIEPTSTSYVVYVQSTKFIKSVAETITIDNTSGNHYIYFNSAGILSSTQVLNADLFQNNALISIIYWNTDTSTHSYFAEERHGLTLDGATHSYLHTVFGAQFISGLALQGFTVDGDGSLATQAQFISDQGIIRDEDLVIQILNQTQIPVLYRQGTLWRKKSADSFPMIYNGTAGYVGSRLPYNQLVSGSWQLTEVVNNGFILVHVFGTNDKETPVIAIQGIAEYGNVTAARLAASTEITSLTGLPFAEFVALGSVVIQSSNAFTNTPKASVRSVDGGNYVDFRGTQLYTPAGIATSHNLLAGLSGDDHIQYHTDARGDARYYTKTEVNGLINTVKSIGDIAETEKLLLNSQISPQDITGFVFSNSVVRGFSALVTVEIDADSDLFEQFTLNGIQKNGSWNMSIESIGDNTGIVLSITSSGQIQYVSPTYTGFTSANIKFRAITTSF